MFDVFYNFSGFNQKLFLLLNHLSNLNTIPQVLQLFSWCFNISNFAIYYVIVACYLYRRLLSRQGITGAGVFQVQFWGIYNEMVRIGTTYALFGFTYAFLKFFVNLPRPFCSLPAGSFATIADITDERCLSSFPSSHVGLAVLVSYFLWPLLTLPQKMLAIAVIFLTALSRIALAMHYPADIFYSVFIAFAVIILGNTVFKLLRNNIVRYTGNIALKLLF